MMSDDKDNKQREEIKDSTSHTSHNIGYMAKDACSSVLESLKEGYHAGVETLHNLKERAVGKDEEDKTLSEKLKERAIGKDEEDKSLSEKLKEKTVGKSEEDKSMLEKVKEKTVGKSEEDKSMLEKLKEKTVGRDEQDKPMLEKAQDKAAHLKESIVGAEKPVESKCPTAAKSLEKKTAEAKDSMKESMNER